MISLGDTYWVEDKNPSSDESHLYFVITEPDENNRVLLVNMTDEDNISDRSCVLNTNDHKSVKKKSVIRYGNPIHAKVEKLEYILKHTNKIQFGPNASDKLVRKIQNGALATGHLEPELKDRVSNSLL